MAGVGDQLAGAVDGYRYANTPTSMTGANGKPRANPQIFGLGEMQIRQGTHCCCINIDPGPNIPEHWYDGKVGWVTYYFTDIEAYDVEKKINGSHKCQATADCDFVAENKGCCDGKCCWCGLGKAPGIMKEHLLEAHNIEAPPLRQWSTGLCECAGCCDAIMCVTCAGSRQIMAFHGHANTFNCCLCFILTLLGFQKSEPDEDGNGGGYKYVPPHILVAALTRACMIQLNSIDEGICKALCAILCCPVCSIAQTYRELSVAGVWPGGTCCAKIPKVAIEKQQAMK